MLRLITCLLALSSLTLSRGASENEELSLTPFVGPQRHLSVRPVAHFADPLNVTIGLNLIDAEVDEEANKVTLGAWLSMEWVDINLGWSGDAVTTTRVSPNQIWTPDIYPYSRVPTIGPWMEQTPAIVYPSGKVLHVPPVSFTVRCQREQTNEKDRITCPFKLGSWTHSEAQMDLHLEDGASEGDIDVSEFFANGHWAVESATLTRKEKKYDCCPEMYVSMQGKVVFKPQRS